MIYIYIYIYTCVLWKRDYDGPKGRYLAYLEGIHNLSFPSNFDAFSSIELMGTRASGRISVDFVNQLWFSSS